MKTNASLPLRILTHNIRYATTDPFEGEEPWSMRKQLIISELRYHTLHSPESFICIQEVLHSQLVDILSGLNSGATADEWSYIGVGRDDGLSRGEYSPILFRRRVWAVPHWTTLWLSETPDAPSKGWDAGSVRIATLGTFEHVGSRKRVLGVCTHFDNAGRVARRESALLLRSVVRDMVVRGGGCGSERLPVFLAGDLNSEPREEAYQLLNAEDSILRDARDMAAWRYGNERTFTGFGDDEAAVIDFVFVGPRGGDDWEVGGHSVLPNRFDDGVFDSDHRATVLDAVLAL